MSSERNVFGLGHFDVADKVGVGNFFSLGAGVFEDKKYCFGAFNVFGGETGFTSTLSQTEKNVGGGNFPSRFLGARTESLEREFGTGIGVDQCISGGNDGARLLLMSVAGCISMCS